MQRGLTADFLHLKTWSPLSQLWKAGPCSQAATENGQDETHAGSAAAPKRKKRAWEEDSGGEGPDSEDERERQRQEDQQAKEEFEQRLRERDEAKTRKIMEAKLSREEIEVQFLTDVSLVLAHELA